MRITVNGTCRNCPEGATLLSFLTAQQVEPNTVVAEHNGSIVQPADFAQVMLAEDDTLELLRFVGGG